MRLRRPTFIIIVAVVLQCGVAAAQEIATKPVRIFTMEAGGGDFVARLIAPGLTASLGRQVIVDSRGIMAGEIVAKSPPDGSVLLAYGSPLWLLPLMRNNVPYDPVRDFAPVTLAATAPNILVVHPAVAAKSVGELVTQARNRPGDFNYGAGSPGSSAQMAAELFNSMAGIQTVRVSYKGTGPALIALIGAQVQLMFPNAGSVRPHLGTGKLRALAVTSAQPSPLAPGLPTLSSSGVPGYESGVPFGIFVPAHTPLVVVSRLHREIVHILGSADIREKFFNLGVETVGGTPSEMEVILRSEMTKWGRLIKEVGIHE